MIAAITCSECSLPSRSPPPGWSSLTGCVASGPSLLPDPSSSDACKRTDRQVRQTDGLRCLRAGRFKHAVCNVCDAHERSIAWGNELGERGGPAGRVCHHGSPERHAAAGCRGDRSNSFWMQLCEVLSPHLQQPSSCVFDMWLELCPPTHRPADAWRDV